MSASNDDEDTKPSSSFDVALLFAMSFVNRLYFLYWPSSKTNIVVLGYSVQFQLRLSYFS
jgi:hypothetical protein